MKQKILDIVMDKKESTMAVNIGYDQFMKPMSVMKHNGQRLIPIHWYNDEMDEFYRERKHRLKEVLGDSYWIDIE